jgi:hypothetical protein
MNELHSQYHSSSSRLSLVFGIGYSRQMTLTKKQSSFLLEGTLATHASKLPDPPP